MTATLPPLLRQRDVLALLGVSRATLWSWRQAGTFPAPIRIGPHVIAWTEVAVREWIARRPAA